MKKEKKIIDSLPAKVYLNPDSKTLLAGGDEEYLGESYLVSERKINDDQPEYICLNKVWHSKNEYPQSYMDICLCDLGREKGCYTGFLDRDGNGEFIWIIPGLVNAHVKHDSVIKWAYIKDFILTE